MNNITLIASSFHLFGGLSAANAQGKDVDFKHFSPMLCLPARERSVMPQPCVIDEYIDSPPVCLYFFEHLEDLGLISQITLDSERVFWSLGGKLLESLQTPTTQDDACLRFGVFERSIRIPLIAPVISATRPCHVSIFGI